MTGLEEFETLFGDVTIATLIELAVVIAFMAKIYKKVKGYIDERKADWLKEERTKEAKEKADLANYAIDAHAMKSDSRYLGFTKLAELSYNHEIAGKENHIDFIEGHYDELMKEVQRMIEVIRQYLGK